MNDDLMKSASHAEDAIPLLGGLDERLRDDASGAFLSHCLDLLHGARAELSGPARTDAPYRNEWNLTDGALQAADQVLRSVWAGFHPQPAASRQPQSL
jgi:hypothetical protein